MTGEKGKTGAVVIFKHSVPFNQSYWLKAQNSAAATLGCFLGCWLTHLLNVPVPKEVALVLIAASSIVSLFFFIRTFFSKMNTAFQPKSDSLTIRVDDHQIIWTMKNGTEKKSECIELFDSEGFRTYKAKVHNEMVYVCVGTPAPGSKHFLSSYLYREIGHVPRSVSTVSVCFGESDLNDQEIAKLTEL